MNKLFGTDGVRGLANSELTPELAFRLGRAGAYVLMNDGSCAGYENKGAPKILIGADSRLSGGMLEAALTAGMCSVGARAYWAGVIPTPAIACLVRQYKANAGVMISASHNPMQDNGIKFFNSGGYKLADALEDKIEELISRNPETEKDGLPRPVGAEVGTRSDCVSAVADYVGFLKRETLSASGIPEKEFRDCLSGMKIAVDCANGATSEAAPRILRELGARVFVIHNEPDGININRECGSTYINSITEYVRETGADIGLAFDGDGDRLLCVDENSGIVDGDQIMSICGCDLKERGLLKKGVMVATVMSNLGLDIMCEKQGIELVKAAVGDRYVLETMLDYGYNFGGEQSGHIIFLDHTTTGDGIFTALYLLTALKKSGKPLSKLRRMEALPQCLIGARIPNERKRDFMDNAAIRDEIKKINDKYTGSGRVLIRPSGTEPLVRVMIEGMDRESVEADAKRLASLIERTLNG